MRKGERRQRGQEEKKHKKCGIYEIIGFEKGDWLYNDIEELLFQIFRFGNGVLIMFKSRYQIDS